MGVVIKVREMGQIQSLNGSTPLVNWEEVVGVLVVTSTVGVGVTDGSVRVGFMMRRYRSVTGWSWSKKVNQFFQLSCIPVVKQIDTFNKLGVFFVFDTLDLGVNNCFKYF
jgi:hypothetical protein